MITDLLYRNNRILKLQLPFSRGDLLNLLHGQAAILSEEYNEQGISLVVDCPQQLQKELEPYLV